MRSVQNTLRIIGGYVLFSLAAAVIAFPVAAEQAIENAKFQDRLGTFPVEISLAHNGVSTLDTGLIGRLYWDETGIGGFGASVVSTGPPIADGTLSSYVSPDFLRANAEFVGNPDEVAQAYSAELGGQVTASLLRYELGAGLLGGLVLMLVFRGSVPPVPRRLRARWTRAVLRLGYVGAGVFATGLVAAGLFGRWDGTDPQGTSYPMPGVDKLSFSSPQTLEVAQQIQPFIEKNTTRIEERTRTYLDDAVANLDRELPLHVASLQPRDNEQVVIAEADSQGSIVGARLRSRLYPQLEELLGDGAIVLRTISGDITSNGTIAERDYVQLEAEASPSIPTVAVKGDHDTDSTVDQLREYDLMAPDLETVEVGGLRVAGAADPAFKALFGGLVENPSGLSEEDLGRQLREVVDPDQAVVVLLHQPRAAAGYLDIASTSELLPTVGHETTPHNDGIPDVPPGMVNVGHLHDASGPWVIWNTDGDQVTWTVVSQLGTSGGVEENPTFNRFSTPFSVPLKAVSIRLEYVNPDTGLQTGYASIVIATDGSVVVEDRVDVGLPGGEPGDRDEVAPEPTPPTLAD